MSTGSQITAPVLCIAGAIGELVELVEVLERAVAPLVVEVVDEGRAVSRCEGDLVAADLGIALGLRRAP